jgi:hypothetical protein
MFRGGIALSKDEELLAKIDAAEAKGVLATRDRLLRAMRAGEPPFHIHHTRWHVPDDARVLPPGSELALSPR